MISASEPRLRECRDCGQFQLVPALPPAARAQCLRCDAVLRHTHRDPLRTQLVLNLTALLLLLMAMPSVLMLVSSAGQVQTADLSQLMAAGWQAPEPFHTTGRDGITEIWGVLYKP